MKTSHWPLFDLGVRAPDLELRLPTDDELAALIEVARAGIHDPSRMPFANPWTDRSSPGFERAFMQWHWKGRADWHKDSWRLGLAVFVDGEPVGAQDVSGKRFSLFRTVESGSWLGAPYQGRGLGKQMRQAMLHFAFIGLGAKVARSSAWADNEQSIGVSASIGYETDGTDEAAPRGEVVDVVRFKLTKQAWLASSRPEVEIVGLEGCIDMFGAES
ncbi:MAG: GNAT family N-acetyltransferase [Actinomycetota bacterium]|nr:GNAT family N-acetyltransferase [Actinomycetota bacterium]